MKYFYGSLNLSCKSMLQTDNFFILSDCFPKFSHTDVWQMMDNLLAGEVADIQLSYHVQDNKNGNTTHFSDIQMQSPTDLKPENK